MQSEDLAEDFTGTINKIVISVFEGKYLRKDSLLWHIRNIRGDAYFFSVNIMEKSVKSLEQ